IGSYGGTAKTLQSKVSASSIPIVIASDQAAIPVSLGNTTNTLLFAAIDVTTSGDNTIVAADASNKIKVLQYVIVADAAVTARWKSGAGTNLSGAMSFAANGGAASSAGAGIWIMETAVNQALVLNLGSAVG